MSFIRSVVGKSVVAAMVLGALTGCKDHEAERRKEIADSFTAARKAGHIDLENPEMGEKVIVRIMDDSVTTTHPQFPKGQVTFAVENHGQKPHVFEIRGKGTHWRSMSINPGGSILMAMVLDPGDYKIHIPDGGADQKKAIEKPFTVTPPEP